MDIQEYIRSGAIESYVLGLADENDVAELQRLKLLHPEVATAIGACEEWLEEYALAQAVAVTPGRRKDVLDSMDEAVSSQDVYRSTRPAYYRYLAAASLILLLVTAGSGYYFYRKYETATANYAILSDPEIIKVPLRGVPGKEDNWAILYWNSKTKNVYLQPAHLPKAPAGKQYQLWALVDGKPVDAGLLDNCEGLCSFRSVAKAQAFAITLEKTGGNPTPTLSQLYVLGNVKS